MRIHLILMLVPMAACLCVPSQGQESGLADQSEPDTRAPVVSAPLVGGTPAFRGELERTNYVRGGIGVGATFDDNALNAETNPKSDSAFSVFPNLSLKQSSGRLNWKLDYFGGFTIHQQFSAYNQASQDFVFESSLKLAEHVDLSVQDHVATSSGFFDQLNPVPSTSAGSVLQEPNQSIITPLARQNSNTATVALNDQFSASSAVGGSGTIYRSYYKDVPPGSILIDTNSQEAEGYYNRRLSARHSLGVTYRFQRFTFSPLANATTTNGVFATYGLHLQPNMTVSFFAGPEHIETATQWLSNAALALPQIQLLVASGQRNFWTGAGGVSYVWNGLHTGLTANVIRTVSNGGGLLGAVTLTGADAAFRRQLSRSLTASLGMNYGQSDSLGAVITPYSSLKSATGSLSLTRQVTESLGFTVGYARAYQLGSGSGSSSVPGIDHNRAWISILYQFSRPLGR